MCFSCKKKGLEVSDFNDFLKEGLLLAFKKVLRASPLSSLRIARGSRPQDTYTLYFLLRHQKLRAV